MESEEYIKSQDDGNPHQMYDGYVKNCMLYGDKHVGLKYWRSLSNLERGELSCAYYDAVKSKVKEV